MSPVILMIVSPNGHVHETVKYCYTTLKKGDNKYPTFSVTLFMNEPLEKTLHLQPVYQTQPKRTVTLQLSMDKNVLFSNVYNMGKKFLT